MSYLVLARKYRPQTFEEVVGQKSVVKTLQNSLKRNRVAHAILFSGVRGVGKTTLARLMAKALNCESGPSPVPCNSCISCQQIASGTALDMHEIDGASNRGIQEVRELKDKIKYLPTSSRYKIVVIDEVHMLTNEAFNALLKTLEEPPEHVYFMFATTELHKIPITILSRCQRYELQRVSMQELSEHFLKLAQSEGIEIEQAALSLIVREAEGSVRDGLSLLDQVLSYGDSPIDAKDVTEVLGLVSRDIIVSIAEALLGGNRAAALRQLEETFLYGMDIRRFIADLLECYRNLLLIKIGGCDQLLDLPETEQDTLNTLAGQHSSETIHQQLCILMRTAEDIRYSFQPRLTLETAFLSIIESGSVVGIETLLEKLDAALSSLPDSSGQQQTTGSAPPSSAEKKTPSDHPEQKAGGKITPPRSETDAADPVAAQTITPAESSRTQPAAAKDETLHTASTASESTDSAARVREIKKDWLDFISYLREKKEWMAQNLQQAVDVKEQGQELLLEFSDPAECTLLKTKENRQALTEFVLNFFQKELTIRFIDPEDTSDPGIKDSEAPKKRRQKLASNPLVRMTEEIFNGRTGDIRIGSSGR